MATEQESGDKTEQPTPKKLKDARRQGQVHKSRDLTSTVELFVWCALALMATGWVGAQLAALIDSALIAAQQPFVLAAPRLAAAALQTLLLLSAVLLLPVALIGLVAEFLQAGPVFALERVKPKFENLDPVQGIKKLFSRDSIMELVKSVLKTALLGAIGWLAIRSILPDLMLLPGTAAPGLLAEALRAAAQPILVWTVVLFVLLAILDAVYQRWSFMKRMRMSLRDIRQEIKESEGDPYIKQHRRQVAQEAAERGAAAAARNANVLVVNPTHVAIAIDYHREFCPVPTIAAKGEDGVARVMREAAEEAGVPVVRNVPLARELLARGEVGAVIPAEFFDVIAEVVLWAHEVRELLAHPLAEVRRKPPGEDCTRYPDRHTTKEHPVNSQEG